MTRINRRPAVLAASLIALANAAHAAPQDESTTERSTKEQYVQDIEELGTTLKAAVVSGTLSPEDATRAWSILVRRTKEDAFPATNDPKANNKPINAGRPLFKPTAPGSPNAIFQPEFLHRDINTLRDALNLDANQLTIVELILDDYHDTLELASTQLRESLINFRRTREDRWLTETLEHIHFDDPEAAVARVREATAEHQTANQTDNKTPQLRRSSKREVDDPWTALMVDATRHLEERFEAIRLRIETEQADQASSAADITRDELVHIAIQLIQERESLRNDVITALEVITNIEQRGKDNTTFNHAIHQLQIERHLRHTRIAGDAINYNTLLNTARTTAGTPEATDHAQTILRQHIPAIAAAFQQRADAEINREVTGIDYFAAAIEALPDDARERSRKNYTRSLVREVNAAAAARDAVLLPLNTLTAALQQDNDNTDIANAFRNVALTSTFPMEMRVRFAETAVDHARSLDDLTDEQCAAIDALIDETNVALNHLRNNAVAARIANEPETTLQIITRHSESKGDYYRGPQIPWDGYLAEQFDVLDENVASQLRAILTPAQYEMIEPSKPELPEGEKNKAPKGPGLMTPSGSKSAGSKKNH